MNFIYTKCNSSYTYCLHFYIFFSVIKKSNINHLPISEPPKKVIKMSVKKSNKPRYIKAIPVDDIYDAYWCPICNKWHIFEHNNPNYGEYPCLSNAKISRFTDLEMAHMWYFLNEYLDNVKRTNKPVAYNPMRKGVCMSNFAGHRLRGYPYIDENDEVFINFPCEFCGKMHKIPYNMAGKSIKEPPCKAKEWQTGYIFYIFPVNELKFIKTCIREYIDNMDLEHKAEIMMQVSYFYEEGAEQ